MKGDGMQRNKNSERINKRKERTYQSGERKKNRIDKRKKKTLSQRRKN